MKDLKARVAYLQGLSTGMDISSESKEGRVLNGIIEVLDEFAQSFRELEEAQGQLEDYLESLDEDLFQLEKDIYKDSAEDPAADDRDYLEVECPRCGEAVCFDSDVLDDEDAVEVTCPNCDEVVFINDDNFQAADEPEQLEGKHIAEDDDL
ncbi:MAG: AraC family transcriptional regulator [Peptococcaceae bacterium]|nr:AraC family transcriptional regulator [Peptococcaceae bacterium]